MIIDEHGTWQKERKDIVWFEIKHFYKNVSLLKFIVRTSIGSGSKKEINLYVLCLALWTGREYENLKTFPGNLRKSIGNTEFITLTITSAVNLKSLIVMTIRIIESKRNNTDDFVIITKKNPPLQWHEQMNAARQKPRIVKNVIKRFGDKRDGSVLLSQWLVLFTGLRDAVSLLHADLSVCVGEQGKEKAVECSVWLSPRIAFSNYGQRDLTRSYDTHAHKGHAWQFPARDKHLVVCNVLLEFVSCFDRLHQPTIYI